MKCVVFGSLNVDYVYKINKLPEKGESVYCSTYEKHVGGKGLNQAISLSKAGNEVMMCGKTGKDGLFLREYLISNNVDVSNIEISESAAGHCIIEVDDDGRNQMVLYGGTNKEITESYCDEVINRCGNFDFFLTQYETSCSEYMLKKAKESGMTTAINPSPYSDELKNFNFGYADYIILNESELFSITDSTDYKTGIEKLSHKTNSKIVLTLGSNGSLYYESGKSLFCEAFNVDAVDTTGAGDTFTGYFFTEIMNGADPSIALKTASAASAICVCSIGAAEAVPTAENVKEFLIKREIG